MTDAQWTALFTVGSPTYKTWAARMDTAALYLKQLEQAKIPVLWRPWHEMNGGWFWWGGNTTHLIQLWRQTYDYLTNTKHVNNLLWVWGPNQWNSSIPNFKDFYPGNQYVDILGADFYSDFFPIGQYNDLLSIGSNRPIAITESGFLPTTAMLNQQPKWSFFIMWCEHVMNAPNDQLKALYNDARVITADEVNYNPIVSIFNKSKDLYLLSNENLKGFYSPSITVYSPSGKEVRGFTDKRSGQNTLQNGIYFVKNGNVTSRIISVR